MIAERGGSVLTDRQAAVHAFIFNSVRIKGLLPTVREVGAQFGIKSPNGVMAHIRSLVRKGYIEANECHSRSYRPLKTPDGRIIKGWEPVTDRKEQAGQATGPEPAPRSDTLSPPNLTEPILPKGNETS